MLGTMLSNVIVWSFIGMIFVNMGIATRYPGKELPTWIWITNRVVVAAIAALTTDKFFAIPKDLNIVNTNAEQWIWTISRQVVALTYVFLMDEAPFPFPKPIKEARDDFLKKHEEEIIKAYPLGLKETIGSKIFWLGMWKMFERAIIIIIIIITLNIERVHLPITLRNPCWLVAEVLSVIITAWGGMIMVTQNSGNDDSGGHRRRIKDWSKNKIKSLVPSLGSPQPEAS